MDLPQKALRRNFREDMQKTCKIERNRSILSFDFLHMQAFTQRNLGNICTNGRERVWVGKRKMRPYWLANGQGENRKVEELTTCMCSPIHPARKWKREYASELWETENWKIHDVYAWRRCRVPGPRSPSASPLPRIPPQRFQHRLHFFLSCMCELHADSVLTGPIPKLSFYEYFRH